jgi:PAS domain S-box-containing protein
MGKKKKKAGDDKGLKRRVRELETQAHVDAALYRIAQAASSVTDMQEFYAAMHGIVDELMDASNFYIALYDEERQMINFPYFVDEVDTDVPDPSAWEPFGVGNARGTTAYLLRTGEPLLLDEQSFDELQVAGELELVGPSGQEWLGVPLKSEGRTLGVLVVQTYTPDKRLTRADLAILTVVGEHIATALERTRLINETRQRSAELTLVNDVQRGLAERLDMQAMYDLVGDRIQEIFDAQVVDIGVVDAESGLVHFPYTIERGVRFPDESLELFGFRRMALETREPVVINEDIERIAAEVGQPPDALIGEASKSCVFVPLVVGDRGTGVISLQNLDREHAFSDADVRLLTTLASSLSVALENARLFEESRRRGTEMATLAELSRDIGGLLDLDAVLGRIAQRAKDLLRADTSAVFLEEGPGAERYAPLVALGNLAELIMADSIQLGEGVIGDLASRGAAEFVNDMIGDPRSVQIPGTETDEDERLMAAPLLVRGRVIGMMAIWRMPPDAEPFNANDLNFLVGLSQQAAIAIENARLFHEIGQQKQYFESLVDISPVAVVTMDRDEVVSGWNPAAEHLFGYSAQDAIGRTIDSLVIKSSEYADEGEAIVREAMEQGRAHLMTRRMRADGKFVEVEIDIVPLVVDGDHQGYYAIYHDVTELQEARRSADAANEAKSAFLATMSHEIRTPMNAIIGMSGLLLGTDLNDEQREYATTVSSSGEALLAIINDILDFSKVEAGKMDLEETPFDVRGCVESAVELVGPAATKKGIEVAYWMEPGTAEVAVGDVSRLRQILLNLLNNAVKFTEEGEVAVSVASGSAPSAGRIAFEVTVRDTGIGIPADRIERLFQSFSQADVSTSRRYGGTGLGLAISRRLAELMNGDVWVESTGVPGEGSTFHLTFEAGATDMTPTALRRDGSFSGRRAMVVDDNATNLRLMTELLGAWGIEATAVGGGDEALASLGDEPLDVVVLDMVMPAPDGLDLAALLHERLPDLPLVMASSVGRREIEADPRWDSAGIGAFVTKPIKASPLQAALASVLGVAHEERAGDAMSAIDPELGARHPLRILLAEDNAVNQTLALRMLEKLGYRADVAGNGIEALEALERQPYDLLLSDVQMPEMDGVEATRQILERWGPDERPWIVAMTAEAMQGDRERFLAAGMNDYVVKPIRIEDLVAALERSPRRGEPEVTSQAVFDESVVQRLLDSLGNDRAVVSDLIGQFLTDAPALVETARAGVVAGDAAEVRRALHTLTSNAATFGATDLAVSSRQLEELAKGGSLDGVAPRLDGIAEQLERVSAALAASHFHVQQA